jgi:hypothetical protein
MNRFGKLIFGIIVGVILGSALVGWSVRATQPKIDAIYVQGILVTIHFDFEANRIYEVQYSGTLGSNAVWITFNVAGPEASPNHWVALDFLTSTQRFYRLKVTP